MGKKNLIIPALCMLFMLAAHASALSEDFSASSGQIIYVGECSSSVSKVLIKNTGDIASHYTVTLEGDAAKWISYAPSSLILKPGEYGTVYMNLNVPCNSKGKYPLQTYITTDLGVKKALSQEIEVRDVQNLEIIPVDYSESITPCKTAVFKFNVKNTGSFAETYEFSISPFGQNTALSQKSMALKPGETGLLQAYVTPDCKIWGDYSLELYTKAMLSGAAAKTSGISLHIADDYDFSLTFGKFYSPEPNKTYEITPFEGDYSLCEEESGAIPVLIKNTASVENTYHFNLKGKSWTTLSGNVATLKPGASAYVNINIAPPKPMSEEFEIEFQASSELGGIEKSAKRKVSVGICRIPLIADGVSKIKTYYEESVASLALQNTGSKEATYSLEPEGASWVSVEPKSLKLAPGEEKAFSLHLSPNNSTEEGKYDVLLKATVAENGVQYVKNIVVSIKDPRFSNMIFDEYLVYTILLILLLIGFLAILVAVVIHLENTKEERLARAEERRKEREIIRLKKEKEKQARILEKQARRIQLEKQRQERKKQRQIMLIQKQKERERLKIEKQKAKERRKAEKEKEAERRKVEKEKLKLERQKEKEKRSAEKAKEYERKKAEKERLKLEKLKEKERKQAEKERLKLEKLKEKERKRLEKENAKIEEEAAKLSMPDSKSKKSSTVKEKLAEAKARADKRIKEPYDFKKLFENKFVRWAATAFFALIAIIILGYIFVKLFPAIAAYKYYWGIGFFSAVIIIIVLFFGEAILSQFYKFQAWEMLAARQKAVVALSWRKGLGEIVIKLKLAVHGARISVKRNVRKSTFVAAGDKVYQYFEVRKKGFENEDIEKVSFRFRVKKKWMQKHSVPPSTIKLVRYNNEHWAGIRTERVAEDKKYVYYLADSPTCSIFAIVGKPKFVPKPFIIQPKPVRVAVVAAEKKEAEKVLPPAPEPAATLPAAEEPVAHEKPKKTKPKRRKKIKISPYAMKLLGIIILIAVILAFITFGVMYVASNISFISNETGQENTTEYISPESEVEVTTPEEAVEEPVIEPEQPETVEEEQEISQEDIEIIIEEIESKPGIFSSIASWLKGFVYKVDSESPLNATENETVQPEEEVAEEPVDEPAVEEEVEIIEPEQPVVEEIPVEEEVDVAEPEENVTEEPEFEIVVEEIEQKPSIFSRIISWIKGIFYRAEPETGLNETMNETSQPEVVEETQEEAEPVVEEIEVVEPEQPAEEEIIEEEEEVEVAEPEEEEEMPIPEGGIPHQKWAMNSEHTLDLSEYFHDPDNDNLGFSYTPLEHITVDIDSFGYAKFTPEENWEGKEIVVFTADDSRGGNVSSNPFELRVIAGYTPPLSERLKGMFSLYSDYVLIGLLILVIIILLIEFRKPIMKFLEED